jgi:hypothetical protein
MINKHTELPWEYKKLICNESKNETRIVYTISIPSNNPGARIWIGDINKENNAEFIIRACNLHYELLEALQYLLEARHMKKAFGKDIVYEHLKKRGWEAAERAVNKAIEK